MPGSTLLDAVSPARQAALAERLLHWYGRNARALPWRAPAGAAGRARPDPYAIWLSEVMLQQTTVAAVRPYFDTFVTRWPRVEDLAATPLEEVLRVWAGLGYYARARNLHACAVEVCRRYGGRFPDREAELRALPGIGPYTAAAIAAIAFGRRASVVDGNVERVISRLFGVDAPLPGAKAELRRRAASLLPELPEMDFPYGDYAQAIMELGATVCLPKRPHCARCPLAGDCRAHAQGRAEALPRQAPKRQRPTRHGIAFWLLRPDGTVLLRRRPPRGLLGGMLELPSTEWREAEWDCQDAAAQAPAEVGWNELPGVVRHTFTHFHLELKVWAAIAEAAETSGQWVAAGELNAAGLPSVMRKVARHALDSGLAEER